MTGHMSSDEFRQHGKALIDWIADQWEALEDRDILPAVEPGDIIRSLPRSAPEQGEDFASVLQDLDRIVVPGLTQWQAPGWFAYFPANASFPAILGDLVSSGLGQQGMLWQTSPATTELEMVVLDWLVDLLGLPRDWKMATGPGGGVIQTTASDSAHTALAVARMRADVHTGGAVAYASDQAHSSIEKGARVAGYGHVRSIPTDAVFGMDPVALADTMDADVAAGLAPAFVNATVGTTGTTGIDPIPAITSVARQRGVWVHVDAAYAGSAMVCPEFRVHQPGLEAVDSYSFNPHKWLLTNFDCSAFWVADRRQLVEALSILPPYLRNAASDSGEAVDYRDWHVPLGRRFRALKLWFVIRHYGAEGLRAHIRRHVSSAHWLAERVEAHPNLVLFAPTPFALVSFTHREGADATRALGKAINATGHSYITVSAMGDEPYIRVSIGSTLTEQRHVERLWEAIRETIDG